jgi:hypothetical protein
MKRTWLVIAALAATFVATPRARAQRADIPNPEPAPHAPAYSERPAPLSVAARGPMMHSATIAPKLEIDGLNEASMVAPRRPFGTSQTLMIVGGAAFLTGVIVGDDAGTVMMVAGAGVGLYGLYLYLREPPGASSRAVGVGYSLPLSR